MHPRVISECLHLPVRGRSYLLPVGQYESWLEYTGMDMIYGYVPWNWGRENYTDEFGCFQYKRPLLEVGDLISTPPYIELRSRLEELCRVKNGRGLEWALYNTPMVVLDGLGLEKFAFSVKDNPQKLSDWMNRIDDRVARELEVVLEYPVEVVQISQVFADKNGQLFGDEELDRFGFQYLSRRAGRLREENRLLSLHCDGDCSKLYERIQNYADVFNGYEGHDFQGDLGKTKMGFRGSVPTVLLETGSPQTIKAYVEVLKRGVPHVIGSTHDTGNVPVDNFQTLMVAARA